MASLLISGPGDLLIAAQHRFEMTLRFTLGDHVTGTADRPTAA
ncbi:hypothetical protein AB0I54_44565 [Streptomyces sp. NPDC050625]